MYILINYLSTYLFVYIIYISYICVNLEVGRRLLLLECQSSILCWVYVISLVWFYFFVFFSCIISPSEPITYNIYYMIYMIYDI